MRSRKIILGLLAVISLLLFSIPISPIGPTCSKEYPSPCGFISNVILVVGGFTVLKSEITSLLLPGTTVQVELDNGEVRQGRLTRKAVSGRPIKAGDKVRLNCLKAYPSVENSTAKMCELEFPGFDPNSLCLKGSPCYGKIPSWSISVDQNGQPDKALLQFTNK